MMTWNLQRAHTGYCHTLATPSPEKASREAAATGLIPGRLQQGLGTLWGVAMVSAGPLAQTNPPPKPSPTPLSSSPLNAVNNPDQPEDS